MRVNPFSIFARYPENISFETQEKGETIVLFLRAHPVTLLPSAVFAVILIVLPFFSFMVLPLVNLDAVLTSTQLFLLTCAWYLFVFGFIFYKFVVWYFNVYIVSNERIIDFDFKGLLNKQTSYALLAQIEDVDPKVIGFFGTIFNFGSVLIQTAAEQNEFEFENVKQPEAVAEVIMEQVRHEETEPKGVVA